MNLRFVAPFSDLNDLTSFSRLYSVSRSEQPALPSFVISPFLDHLSPLTPPPPPFLPSL